MASLLSRDLPHVSRPALLMSFSYVVTGSIYLGISFIFPRGGAAAVQASIAWYILAGAESLLNAVSHIFGSGLSFKDTHLVERMSLLTLIIIGEGVIGLLEAVVAAWNGGPHDGSFFTSFIEGVICGTMILVSNILLPSVIAIYQSLVYSLKRRSGLTNLNRHSSSFINSTSIIDQTFISAKPKLAFGHCYTSPCISLSSCAWKAVSTS